MTALIVGASIGGVRTAQALRSNGYPGRIVLVGDEPVAPYDKPPLSKGLLAGTEDPTALLTHAEAEKSGIDLVFGTAAQRLDLAKHEIELADGTRLRFDDLVIATGARARPSPWGSRPGVHLLRTLDDAQALRKSLADGGPLVIVGAGFIGAEVAATARKLGVENVTLVDPLPVPMSRALSAELANRLADLHRRNGVQTRFGTGVRAIESQGTIRLDDASVLDAATVLVGIGAIPNDDWLADSGLRIDNGIVCDEHGLAAPDVHAVGDVARWYHPGRGEHVRFEHWTSALEQAAHVAATIANPEQRRPHHSVEYVWSDQYDCKLQLAGRTGDEFHHIAITGPRGALAVLYADADRLAGSATLNWPRAMITLRRALPHIPSLAEAEAAVTDLRR